MYSYRSLFKMIEMSPTHSLKTVYARGGAKIVRAKVIDHVRLPIEGIFS